MKKLLNKEMKLSASPLSFLFIVFGFMALIPNYPILCGAFFICLGIFQSFQTSRENSDVLYSVLLPVSKSDAVKSKFIFCIFIELCGFAVMTAMTLVRMMVLKDAAVYRNNALMNANFVFLAFALLIFALFNLIFVSGFFKTAFYFAKPFVIFIIAAFLTIGIAETLHHIPSLEKLNAFGFDELPMQVAFLAAGVVLYALITLAAVKKSEKRFEKIDL